MLVALPVLELSLVLVSVPVIGPDITGPEAGVGSAGSDGAGEEVTLGAPWTSVACTAVNTCLIFSEFVAQVKNTETSRGHFAVFKKSSFMNLAAGPGSLGPVYCGK